MRRYSFKIEINVSFLYHFHTFIFLIMFHDLHALLRKAVPVLDWL